MSDPVRRIRRQRGAKVDRTGFGQFLAKWHYRFARAEAAFQERFRRQVGTDAGKAQYERIRATAPTYTRRRLLKSEQDALDRAEAFGLKERKR